MEEKYEGELLFRTQSVSADPLGVILARVKKVHESQYGHEHAGVPGQAGTENDRVFAVAIVC